MESNMRGILIQAMLLHEQVKKHNEMLQSMIDERNNNKIKIIKLNNEKKVHNH
jgi:hypothetical protein